MARRSSTELAFTALVIEGGLLAPDFLNRIAHLEAAAQSEADYDIPRGLKLRDEIGSYWKIAQNLWQDFAARRDRSDRDTPGLPAATSSNRSAARYSVLPTSGASARSPSANAASPSAAPPAKGASRSSSPRTTSRSTSRAVGTATARAAVRPSCSRRKSSTPATPRCGPSLATG